MESLDNAALDGVPLQTLNHETIQKILWGVQHVSVYDAIDHRRLDDLGALPNYPHLDDRAVRKPWEMTDESPLMKDFMSSIRRVAAMDTTAKSTDKKKTTPASPRPRSGQAQASATLEAALSPRDPHKMLEEALGRLRGALMRTLQRYDFRRMTGLTVAAQEFLDGMNDTQFSVFRKRVGDRYAHAVSAALMRYSQQAQAMNERGVFDPKANAARVISMAESEAVRPQGAVHIDSICRGVLLEMIAEHQLGEEAAKALLRERSLEARLLTPGASPRTAGEGRGRSSSPRPKVTHILPDGDIKRWDVSGAEVAAAAVTGVGRHGRSGSSPRSKSPSPRSPPASRAKGHAEAKDDHVIRHAGDAGTRSSEGQEHHPPGSATSTHHRRSVVPAEEGVAAGLAVQSTRRNSLRRPSLIALDTKQKEESTAQRSLRVWRDQQRAMDTTVSYGGDAAVLGRLWNVERGIEMTAAVLARLLEDAISESAQIFLDAVPGAEGGPGHGGASSTGGRGPGGRRQSAFGGTGSSHGHGHAHDATGLHGSNNAETAPHPHDGPPRDYNERHQRSIAWAYKQAAHPGDLLLPYTSTGGTQASATPDHKTNLNPFDKLLLEPASAMTAAAAAEKHGRSGAPPAYAGRPGSRGASSLAFPAAPTAATPAVAKAGSSLATMYAHVTFAMDRKRATAPGFKASISGLVPWEQVRRTETPAQTEGGEAGAGEALVLEDNQVAGGEGEGPVDPEADGEGGEEGADAGEDGNDGAEGEEGEEEAGDGEAAAEDGEAAASAAEGEENSAVVSSKPATGVPASRKPSPKRSKKGGRSILDKVPEPSPMRWPSRDRLVKLVERELAAEAAVASSGVLPFVGSGRGGPGSRPGSRSGGSRPGSRPGSSSSAYGGRSGSRAAAAAPAPSADINGSFVVGPATILHVIDGRVPAPLPPMDGLQVPPASRKLTVFHIDNSGVAVGAPTVGIGGGVAPAAALVPAGPSTAVLSAGMPLSDADLREGQVQHEGEDGDGPHAGGPRPDPTIPGLTAPHLVPPKAIPLLETTDFATYSVYQRPLPFGTAVDAPDVDLSRRAAAAAGNAIDPFVGHSKALSPRTAAAAAAAAPGLGSHVAGPGGTGAAAQPTGNSHASAFPSTRRRSVAIKSAVEIVADARAALLPMVVAPTYHRTEVVRAIDAAAKAEAGGLAAGARKKKKGEAKEESAHASGSKAGGRPPTPPNAEAAHEKGERWWEVHGFVPDKTASVPQGFDLSGIVDPVLTGGKARAASPALGSPGRATSPIRGVSRSLSPTHAPAPTTTDGAPTIEPVPPMSPPGFSPGGLKDAPHIEVRQGRTTLKFRTMSRGLHQSVDDLTERAADSAQLPVQPHLRVLALGAAAADRALPVKLSAVRPIPVVGFPVPKEVWYPGMPTEEERQAARQEYRERRGKPKQAADGEEGGSGTDGGGGGDDYDAKRRAARKRRRIKAAKEAANADLGAWKRRKWSTGSPTSSRGSRSPSPSPSRSRSRSPTPYKPVTAASEGRQYHHYTSHREAAAAATAAAARGGGAFTPDTPASSRTHPVVAVTHRVSGLVTATFGPKSGVPEDSDFLPVSTTSSVFLAAAEGGASVGGAFVALPPAVLQPPPPLLNEGPPGSASSDGSGTGTRSELVTPSDGVRSGPSGVATPASRAGLLTPGTPASGGGALKGKLIWASRKNASSGDQRRSRKGSPRSGLQSRLTSSRASQHYAKEGGGLWGLMTSTADAAQDAALAVSESSEEEEDEALPLLLDELVEALTRSWTRLKYPGTDRTQKIILYSQNHLVMRMQEAVLLWTEAADAVEALVGARSWLKDLKVALRDSQAALEIAEAAEEARKAAGGTAKDKAAAAAAATVKVHVPTLPPALTGSAALRAVGPSGPSGFHAPLARGGGALPSRMQPQHNPSLALLKHVTPGAKPIVSPEMAAVNRVPLVMVPILSHALISYLSALCLGAEAYLSQAADLNAGLRAVAGLPRHEPGSSEWSVGATPGAPSPLLTFPRVALPASARLLKSLEGLDMLGTGLLGALEHRVEDACTRVSEAFPDEEVFYKAASYRRLLAAGLGK